MKKIISIILMLALLTTVAFTMIGCENNDETLFMFTEGGYAPFEYYAEGDKIVGIDVDVVSAIAKKLNLKLVIQDIAFDSIVTEVKLNENKYVIGAAAVTITAERAETIDFSNPYYDGVFQFAITKTGAEVTNLDGLANKKVGVQTGTSGDIVISSVEKAKNIKITRNSKVALLIEDLKAGNLDYVVVDNEVGANIIKENVALKGNEITDAPEKYGLMVKKGNAEFLKSINEVIANLIKEGKIEEFKTNHKDAE